MATSTSQPTPGRTIFLFGPQFLSFTVDSLAQLRSHSLESPGVQEWVLQIFSELPRHWDTVATAFPLLEKIPGRQQLEDLFQCMHTGNLSKSSFPLPNFLLCPLVVVTQLAQYLRYQKLHQSQRDQAWHIQADSESIGFCTGLLSALVVSNSATRQQLEQNGAAAVRLAMLIGATVDARDLCDDLGDRAVSFSAAWQSHDGKAELDRILEAFPEAYVSVSYDENRSTVTTSNKSGDRLFQKLKDARITAVKIGLQGRFHDSKHASIVGDLVNFCESHSNFTFPHVSNMLQSARNPDGEYIKNGSLHDIALQAILVDHCDWYQTFTRAKSQLADEDGVIISFGLERCVPPSYLGGMRHRLIHMADVDSGKSRLASMAGKLGDDAKDYIAVVGMSCRVPNADSLEDFWTLLCENKSQHIEVPSSRFSFETAWRETDPKRKWFGNFIQDYEAFDYKFFHKSPREATAMDPQQKMMLQAAYQAVEQSGYFQSSNLDKHIGCYIGVSNVDYQDNVACYPANAFTATGALMSFVAGKVSHYFGWTGPSMSIDTACSGSAVAIHEACKAILSGDCTTALAGGVNAITSPLWFQNLAGASFLSTTGQCKPFDANGDGYCRGEAVGAVYLKRLSAAIADGDLIFGTIAATAVQQNQNSTAITVPNSTSLSDLFRNVTRRAQIDPSAISVVEAHGTGTAVGDPAEYDSIRQVFGGQKRSNILALRSVKGLIGHAECASGIIALIKTLLMIHKGIITPQASHDTINPALHASPSDKIEISTRMKPWNTDLKAALINNYGASGSNASMVAIEAPKRRLSASSGALDEFCSPLQPFWFCGVDDQSLHIYVSKFLSFLRSKTISGSNVSLPNLSFNLARQSNRSLSRALIFHTDSMQNLEGTLEAFQRGEHVTLDVPKISPAVILCFGGQISTFVGLDRQVFKRTTILKKYMDECNLVCESLGLQSIYPAVFQQAPIEDTVQLQTSLFAVQYSSAKSWIDCGVQVAAAVGHSFGEIVAHTVAGALTLVDGMKVISRRARIIQDLWESDRGSMMAIEAEIEVVQSILARANKSKESKHSATIACFNGPRSFTIAGSTRSIKDVERVVSENKDLGASIRCKKLNTTHAFHSTLVESLISHLEQITHDIKFSEPNFQVERATITSQGLPLSTTYIAEHLRQPVYFNHAVQRLAKQYNSAIWLEAGSQSTVTTMASKALGAPRSSHFQNVNLTSDDSWQRLTETTIALWKQGLRVAFWPHHSSKEAHYTPLILPQYQFDKSKHFFELKKPHRLSSEPIFDDRPCNLWTFIEYQDTKRCSARFRIETDHKTFQELMAGHTVAHSEPLCPSTLQLDIATEAVRSLCPEFHISDFQIDLRDLENQAPICRDASRVVWLDATAVEPSRHTWSWKIVSNLIGTEAGKSIHASGKLIFRSRDDLEFLGEFRRFERLVTHARCQAVLEDSDADDIFQGSAIYKLFADVVNYSEVFRGVRKVVGRSNESAGRVVKKYSGETWLDTPLCDSFCQVAGVFVNCMTQRPDGDAFISNGVERVVRSPFIRDFEDNPEVFDVFALHHRPTQRSFSSDVFIFDSRSSQLLGVILGIQYQRVSKLAMANLLARLTPDAGRTRHTAVAPTKTNEERVKSAPSQANPSETTQSLDVDVRAKISATLSEMVGVEPGKIIDSTNLADLGIDSLMGMEVAREFESVFNCALDMASMMALVEFGDLVKWVRSALGEGNEGAKMGVPADIENSSGFDDSSASTTSASPSPSNHGNTTPITPAMTDISSRTASPKPPSACAVRQTAVNSFVAKYCNGFTFPLKSVKSPGPRASSGHCVLVTGATGSLGAHLVEHLTKLSSVTTVVCLNRPRSMDPILRQRQAFTDKGIVLDGKAFIKLQVIASDTSKPRLGLDETIYARLVDNVTHIVHNAWPMSITRPISDFEKQFVTMRNLIELARDASYKLPMGTKFGFQFISSIATVGLYPAITGQSLVPEEPSEIECALPSGYSDAKVVCERLLSETLNRYSDRINIMTLRVGQVAGSKTNGYWNPSEHIALLIKSAQTLNALPELPGHLSWFPVNDVAVVLADLMLSTSQSSPSPILHVENPTRQPWSEMISLLATELGIPGYNVIPYQEWLGRVRSLPSERGADNPAQKVIQFLEKEFLHMACGGLVLDTKKACRLSDTLSKAEPVSPDLVKKYVHMWKTMGFL